MIVIDPRSSTPIYEQIVIRIKELILKGVLEPGDKLPSVRELSGIITANPNTVSKAYAELERQKVIETIRGRGTFVVENYKPRIQEDRMEALKEDLKKVILEAKYMGLTKEELVDIMDIYYEEFNTHGEEGKN
ncbi:GntR family transcriptional regulator [Clostridium sp. HMP27]|uniref:GntR family transcriptional regulator n=1 Tax=Clostridium sp. HMP27 TaxID=1487921 RepID=UPI00052C031B|nr:GntR family transcriptional regulator [Clostridium sp. HMP27]KGK85516.1 GntR family transcriptional regulator [Clostridium sp. HMP27]